MNVVKWISGLALAMSAIGTADAAVTVRDLTVKNAGFEAEQLGDGEFCRGCIPDWAAVDFGVPNTYNSNGSGLFDPPAGSGTEAPGGNQFAFVDAYVFNTAGSQGGLLQMLDENVVLGTEYSLSLDVVRRLANPLADWVAEIVVGEAMTTVASGTLTSAAVPAGGFSPLTLSYTGTADDAGKAVGIRFRSFYDRAQGSEYRTTGIDNVRMTATPGVVAAVPEPSTWAMMIGGFGMVGAAARRRRRIRPIAA